MKRLFTALVGVCFVLSASFLAAEPIVISIPPADYSPEDVVSTNPKYSEALRLRAEGRVGDALRLLRAVT